ncbi:pseudouridine synthase [Auriscalpium vulgare]|uniref:Pseudouridine synthase n=1 Tax=Auriscalpium vulgare TaxID=40419 RepID=A0ACB8RXF2_9AGAM|nr:pseudouridine synthase [Auriscalpium vulgare]
MLRIFTILQSKLASPYPVFYTNKVHLPLILLPPAEQFRHVFRRMILAAMAPEAAPTKTPPTRQGLRKIAPYWFPYTTMAKGRWYDREILEIVSTEFRDRSVEYYRYALESGVTTVNGKVALPGTIVRNGDRLENIVHRHEPPVTSTPVRILHEDREREFIVIDKPGSIPVHATGRYFYLSLVEILQRDFNYEKVYTVNRLDRLTSGLMIIGLSSQRARTLSEEFLAGGVKKEYIARCSGEFPEGETIVEEPLLTVDRQMGLNIVHPDGKHAKTIFTRLRYDANTNSSVLHCRPLTGRSHQIRVHLQFLGFPVANDPVYSETRIWGPNLGRGGIDTTPSEDRSAPVPPPHLQDGSNPELLSPAPTGDGSTDQSEADARPKLLPRETGHDIGMGSPVPLSAEAVGVITRLRNMKDEDEDWSRWRDVVFKAKGALHPKGIKLRPLPPQSKRLRGGPSYTAEPGSTSGAPIIASASDTPLDPSPSPPQLTEVEALELLDPSKNPAPSPAVSIPPLPDAPTPALRAKQADAQVKVQEQNDGALYCEECYLPLHPDPPPEKLYIFLHALRYTTSLGVFETEMPEWAAAEWDWERS